MKKAPSTFCFGPSLFPFLLLGVALCGCSETSSPDPALLNIVAGDGQEAVAGTALDSLVVRVTDLEGTPRSQVAVSWAPSEGQGTIDPATGMSDEQGLVAASWTLGPNHGAQAVTVSAQGSDTIFQAWATPPPPSDWLDFLEIRPAAQVQGTDLLTSVRILNHWPGTIRLFTPKPEFCAVGYPAVFSAAGDEVAHYHVGGSWLVGKYYPIGPGDSISKEWTIGIEDLDPGEYTVRFRFDVQEINGTPGSLPDTATAVTIQG
jgi:hypothetical protein